MNKPSMTIMPETARLNATQRRNPARGVVLLIGLLAGMNATAQSEWGGGASPVGYTVAVLHPVSQSIQLPGYVESPTMSQIAGEIDGLVTELLAREGDRVEKDQPMARLRTEPLKLRLRAVRAQLQEADARLKLAQRNRERARELYDAKTVSQQQLDETVYEADAWAARLENLKAEIAAVEFDIDRSTVRAPFVGVVVSRHTQVGQWADAGQVLFELMSLADLEIHVDVPERYFAALENTANATVTFDSLPGHAAQAGIRAVIPRADPQARTFPVKLRLTSNHVAVGVGMLARVGLPLGGVADGVLVPKDAIIGDGDEKNVYVINDDGTVAPVPVATGSGQGAWIQVHGGIQAGQKVVTRGNERLQPGQQVTGEPVIYPAP